MTKTSVFPDVLEALHDLLQAELPGKVFYGGPTREMPNEFVGIGDIEDGLHSVPTAKAGRKSRDEEFLLVTNVVVKRPGSTPRQSIDRAMEIMGTMEDVVANDITLGLRDMHSTLRCEWDEFELQNDVDDGGWRTTLIYKLRVRCRLS